MRSELRREPMEPHERETAMYHHEQRPKTRGECSQVERPCMHLSCRHHLYLEVTEAGSLKLNATEPADMADTCSLDVADRGGVTLDTVGQLMGLTRERIRQIEQRALRALPVDFVFHR